jgi:hypothetical protein
VGVGGGWAAGVVLFALPFFLEAMVETEYDMCDSNKSQCNNLRIIWE